MANKSDEPKKKELPSDKLFRPEDGDSIGVSKEEADQAIAEINSLTDEEIEHAFDDVDHDTQKRPKKNQ